MTQHWIALDPAFHRLVPADAKVERIATGFAFTEGPVWRGDHLLFSDIPNSRIVRWQGLPEGPEVRTFRLEYTGSVPLGDAGHCNGMTLDAQGRLIVCGQGSRRLTRTEPDGTITVLAERFEGRRLNSPNDVVAHPDGSLYFTDPPHGLPSGTEGKELPFQGVYRLTAAGELTLLADDFAHPNGLAFSPDRSLLYVGDDARGQIRAFEVRADGSLANGRLFATIPLPATLGPGENPPDGMKVDMEGNLYVTAMGGVWLYSADARLLGIIHLPEATANLGWGGPDWRTLFITASTSLYRVRLSVPGVPVGPEAR